MIMKTTVLLCLMLFAAVVGTEAQIKESFNYPAGTLAKKMNSGIGIVLPPESNLTFAATASGLSYPGLTVSGNAARGEANEFPFQNVVGSATGTSVRVSALVRPETGPLPVQMSRAFFSLGTEDFKQISFGKFQGQNEFNFGVELNGIRHFSTKQPAIGTVYYLVLQIDYQAGNERVRLWINPPALNNLASDAIAATADVDVATADFKGLSALEWTNQMPQPDFTIDEIRVEKVVPIPCSAVPNNSIAWFPFDDPSGNVLKNVASGGVNGTYFNNPTTIAGKVGQARNFNGSNQFAEVDSTTFNFGLGDFSIYAWVKIPVGANGTMTIADKRESSPSIRGYAFFISNGKLGLQLANGIPTPDTFSNFQASNVSLADGNWHHVGVTVKRGLNGIKWYVDGVQAGSANPILRTGNLNNSGKLVIGRASVSTSGFFKGAIDELEIFGRVISASEIKSVVVAQSSGKCRTS